MTFLNRFLILIENTFGCFNFLSIHFTITRKITSARRRELKRWGVLAPIQDEIKYSAIDKNNRKRKRTKITDLTKID